MHKAVGVKRGLCFGMHTFICIFYIYVYNVPRHIIILFEGNEFLYSHVISSSFVCYHVNAKGDDSDDITAAITSAGSGCVAISCKP